MFSQFDDTSSDEWCPDQLPLAGTWENGQPDQILLAGA